MAERLGRGDAERGAAAVGRLQRRPVPQLQPERTVGQRARERALQLRRPAHVASLAACRSGETRTTSQASPVLSSAQMTQADGSQVQRPSPWRADVGNAWWLLWYASPKVKNASQCRLRDSSPVLKRCLPKKWQSELMLYVEWCRTSMRTAPPHSRPVSAAVIVPPIAQPSRNGATSPATTQRTNVRLTKETTGS